MDIIIKIFISAVIIAFCGYIYFKTDRIFRLSSHKGIRSFRDAFMFFGLAFIFNIGVVAFKDYPNQVMLLMGLHIAFNYTLAMGGFLLVYSLVWKDMAADWQYVLHAAALSLAAIDFFYMRYAIFISQLAILGYGIVVSFSSYKQGKQPMRQLLFIAIVIAFIGYAINLFSAIFSAQILWLWLFAYIITLAAFAILSLAVAKSLGGQHG